MEALKRERITGVAKQFFTDLHLRGLAGLRPRGAPSWEYGERVKARGLLVKAFLETYVVSQAPSGEGGVEVTKD